MRLLCHCCREESIFQFSQSWLHAVCSALGVLCSSTSNGLMAIDLHFDHSVIPILLPSIVAMVERDLVVQRGVGERYYRAQQILVVTPDIILRERARSAL